jgi:hypothetical protein
MVRQPRHHVLVALVSLLALVVSSAGCELLALYSAYKLVDDLINDDKGDTTARVVYVVESSGADNAAIVGARIELFALRTGGDPNRLDDFEVIADAIRETNDDGEALVYIKDSPNEAGDNVIRPSTAYRVVVTAPGFQAYEGVQDPLSSKAGLVKADPVRLVPLQ